MTSTVTERTATTVAKKQERTKKVGWNNSIITPEVQHDIDVHKDLYDWIKCIINGWVDFVPKYMMVSFPGESTLGVIWGGQLARSAWECMLYAYDQLDPELRDLKNDRIVIRVNEKSGELAIRWKKDPKETLRKQSLRKKRK